MALQCRLALACYAREAGAWHGASKEDLAWARVYLKDPKESSESVSFIHSFDRHLLKACHALASRLDGGDTAWRKQTKPHLCRTHIPVVEDRYVNHTNTVCRVVRSTVEESQAGEGSGVGWVVVGCLSFCTEHEIRVWRVREDPRRPGLTKAIEGYGTKRHKEISLGDLKAETGREAMGPGGMEGWKVRALPEACGVLGLFFTPWSSTSGMHRVPPLPVCSWMEEWRSGSQVALRGTVWSQWRNRNRESNHNNVNCKLCGHSAHACPQWICVTTYAWDGTLKPLIPRFSFDCHGGSILCWM